MDDQRFIPEISDDLCIEFTKKIQPVFDFPGKGLCYIRHDYPKGVSFAWNPKPARLARDVEHLRDIETYHSYTYFEFFMPSLREVIAQIPEDIRDQVIAFEFVGRAKPVGDVIRDRDAIYTGYHLAVTRLYCKKKV